MRIHILLPTTLAFRCYKWLIMFAIQKRSYINKSVFTLVLRLSTWRYQLSACIAYQLSIGICCRRPRSAANQPHVVVAVDRPDRQTDGRTPDRYIDSTPHTVDESPPLLSVISLQYYHFCWHTDRRPGAGLPFCMTVHYANTYMHLNCKQDTRFVKRRLKMNKGLYKMTRNDR